MGFDYRHHDRPETNIHPFSESKYKFNAFPTMRDTVTVKTWPVGIQQKVFFTRDFYFTAQDGTRLASATTAWILVDPSARRMLLPNALKGESTLLTANALWTKNSSENCTALTTCRNSCRSQPVIVPSI
jgi:acyl-CoA thioesterase FadM